VTTTVVASEQALTEAGGDTRDEDPRGDRPAAAKPEETAFKQAPSPKTNVGRVFNLDDL
jgi:hypothetical protein